MILPTSTSNWSSAHRPILFGIDNPNEAYAWDFSGVVNVNGKAQFTNDTGSNIYDTPPCRYLYISSGTYAGFHRVKSIDSNGDVLTYSDYNGNNTGSGYCLVNLIYRIHYGYPSQSSSVDLEPIWKWDGTLIADLHSFLSRVFPSPMPPPVAGFDENMYTWFKVEIIAADDFQEFLTANSLALTDVVVTSYDWTVETYYCANASIPTSVLNSDHVGSAQVLAPGTPILFSGATCIYSRVVNNRIYNVII